MEGVLWHIDEIKWIVVFRHDMQYMFHIWQLVARESREMTPVDWRSSKCPASSLEEVLNWEILPNDFIALPFCLRDNIIQRLLYVSKNDVQPTVSHSTACYFNAESALSRISREWDDGLAYRVWTLYPLFQRAIILLSRIIEVYFSRT